jgi:hypothetical protein
MSITIGPIATRVESEIRSESTSQKYLDPAEMPAAVEETTDGVILDPTGLRVGDSIVYPLEGQRIMALRADDETVEFYLLPDVEAQGSTDSG